MPPGVNRGPNLESIGIPKREINLVRTELLHQVTQIQRRLKQRPSGYKWSFDRNVGDIWNILEFWAQSKCGADLTWNSPLCTYTTITFKKRHQLSWFLLDRHAKSSDDDEDFILFVPLDNKDSVKVVVNNNKPFDIEINHATGIATTSFHYM